MSISTIFPCLTATLMTDTGLPSTVVAVPAKPLTSTGLANCANRRNVNA